MITHHAELAIPAHSEPAIAIPRSSFACNLPTSLILSLSKERETGGNQPPYRSKLVLTPNGQAFHTIGRNSFSNSPLVQARQDCRGLSCGRYKGWHFSFPNACGRDADPASPDSKTAQPITIFLPRCSTTYSRVDNGCETTEKEPRLPRPAATGFAEVLAGPKKTGRRQY
jgi:hypothetical protein